MNKTRTLVFVLSLLVAVMALAPARSGQAANIPGGQTRFMDDDSRIFIYRDYDRDSFPAPWRDRDRYYDRDRDRRYYDRGHDYRGERRYYRDWDRDGRWRHDDRDYRDRDRGDDFHFGRGDFNLDVIR